VLYTFFVIQPPNPWQRINIPITNDELRNLKCLVQAYCDNQVSTFKRGLISNMVYFENSIYTTHLLIFKMSFCTMFAVV